VTSTCPACGSDDLRPCYEQPAVPVNSLLLLPTAEQARAFPTAPLELVVCGACGFVLNRAFDPGMTRYSADYEETQGFSPRFRAFAAELAQGWVERYDLTGRTVLEVGCGKGEFLAELVRQGVGHGIGYDPVWAPGRTDPALDDRLDFRPEVFDRAVTGVRPDAVVCRHTLEHVPDVRRFLQDLAHVLRDAPDAVLLFEVPDVRRILDAVAFWDVFYEHCSYFSAGSLGRLFRSCGFELLDLRRAFDDQYLVLEARRGRPGDPTELEDDLPELLAGAERFAQRMQEARRHWRGVLDEAVAAGRTVVLWGSGSKSVAFLTTMQVTDEVAAVVDINPHKHGTYNAGTGQRIVAPEELRDLRPDLVVVMNAAYEQEIRSSLADLGLAPEVAVLR
jgi:SAM-dependent methyltransferase